jgi:hypothetical protein
MLLGTFQQPPPFFSDREHKPTGTELSLDIAERSASVKSNQPGVMSVESLGKTGAERTFLTVDDVMNMAAIVRRVTKDQDRGEW